MIFFIIIYLFIDILAKWITKIAANFLTTNKEFFQLNLFKSIFYCGIICLSQLLWQTKIRSGNFITSDDTCV